MRLVSGKLGHSPPGFSSKLTEKSLEKLEQYNNKKVEQSLKKVPAEWQYFSKAKK